jgi:5'-methylthioadenosine phosphorylase
MPIFAHHPDPSFIVLAPPGLLPTPAAAAVVSLATPYGPVQHHQGSGHEGVGWLSSAAPPRALIYAAKEMGAARVIEVLPLHPINRLLEPGDLLVPDHLLDLTRGHDLTFFVGKGYGFLPQHPPFCPVVRDALITASRQVVASEPLARQPRVFVRGTYGAVAVAPTPDIPPDASLQQTCALWGADAVGSGGVPTSFLARELELCYAPLGCVRGEGDEWPAAALPLLLRVLQATPPLLPPDRSCPCARAMQSVRERGMIGDDWHTWVSPVSGPTE